MCSTRPQRAASALVVRHQHQRGVRRGVEIEQQLADARAGGRIEVAGGLVGKQHGGLRDERARDRDALLLAARELPRIVRRCARSARRGPASRSARGARIAAPGELQRQHHVFQRRERGNEVKGLEHEARRARRAAAPGRLRRAREIGAGEPDLAGSGRSRPASSASSVDLPAPEAPTMATDSPAAMSNDTSSTMVSSPSGLLTFLVRSSGFENTRRDSIVRRVGAGHGDSRVGGCDRARAAHRARARRQSERRLRHQARPGLGRPARETAAGSRVRIPRGQRQRERRNHRRRTRSGCRARSSCTSPQIVDRRTRRATTACAACRSPLAATICAKIVDAARGRRARRCCWSAC